MEENVGDWRGNCLNMCMVLSAMGMRRACASCMHAWCWSIEFRVSSGLASMAEIKATPRLMTELVTVSGDQRVSTLSQQPTIRLCAHDEVKDHA